MVSTISRKSSKSKSRNLWVWPAIALLVAIIIVYAWIDGGYREVRLIEEPLDPQSVDAPSGNAVAGDAE